jgi:hypothetical protein
VRRYEIPADEEVEIGWAEMAVEASRLYVLYKSNGCLDKASVDYAKFVDEAGSLRWEDLRRMEPRYPMSGQAIAVAVYAGGGSSSESSGGGSALLDDGKTLRMKHTITGEDFDVYLTGDEEEPEIRVKKVVVTP